MASVDCIFCAVCMYTNNYYVCLGTALACEASGVSVQYKESFADVLTLLCLLQYIIILNQHGGSVPC